MAETFSGNEFGTYIVEPATGDDVWPFTEWFENRSSLKESWRNAVYARDIEVIEACFRRTMGVLVKRKLDNNKEVIIAYTGAYPVTAVYEKKGTHRCTISAPRIRLDENIDKDDRPFEIGTTITIPHNDVPNADGHLPDHWLFNVLVPSAVSNLFYLAGDEVGTHNIDFDMMVANIQKRLEKIHPRLLNLGWEIIENPTMALRNACASTTTDQKYSNDQIWEDDVLEEEFVQPKRLGTPPRRLKSDPPPPPQQTAYFKPTNASLTTTLAKRKIADPNFIGNDKVYYQLPIRAMPRHAELFLDCFNNQFALSEHRENQQKIHLEMRFPKDMVDVMYGIIGKKILDPESGYVDVRRRVFREEGNVERGRTLYEEHKKIREASMPRQLAFA